MGTYEVWKIAVDVSLSVSLLFLAFRFFKTGQLGAQSRKGLELEATLRRLIQDAREAGNDLNEELYRRQVSLEKALSNIEQAEARIRTVSNLADEKCQAIDGLLSRTHKVIETVKGHNFEDRELERERIQESTAKASPIQQAYQPSARKAPRPAPAASSSDPYAKWLDQQASSGERHDAQSLRKSIEREVELPSAPAGSDVQSRLKAALTANAQANRKPQQTIEDMEKIYALAESLLRAGRDVESVVRQTSLPARRVQAIAEMVSRERSYGGGEDDSGAIVSTSGLSALAATGKREVEPV